MPLSQEIIQKIKEEKIAPKPRWEFMLKNYVIWLFGVVSLLIGSIAMAIIIYIIRHNDWDLYDHLANSLSGFVFLTLPYFWLIILVIFIAVVYYNIRHTKTGYNYNLLNIILVSIILSVMLGQIFYNLGLAKTIDQFLANKFSVYDEMFCKNSAVWHRPERGLIIGNVAAPIVSQQMLVDDLDHKRWLVLMHQMPVAPPIIAGQRIKVIGDMIGDHEFVAQEIRFSEICTVNTGCQEDERSITCVRSK